MNITQEFDTIAAIATPMGTGGVGIIRISGEKSFEIAQKLFQKEFKPGRINHGRIYNLSGDMLDEIILLAFNHPNSYTGEDVIEFQCHGGINVLRNILDTVLNCGARLAEKGEFTKRAFLNGKIDLSQAEAVCDLIHAKTQKFAVKTTNNLSGLLNQKIKQIKNGIFELLSRITAGIDFPEDVKEPEYDYIEREIQKSISLIDEILNCAKSSNILRQGLKIAIMGKPNVGKSSLFNLLLSLERAIVTDIAGTTRDILTETLDFDGIPLTLIDTAGIRSDENIDKVEEIGIEYSKQAAQEADLILFLYDASKGMTSADENILDTIKNKNYIKIANKSDLISQKNDEALYLSTVSKEGLDEIKEQIKKAVDKESIDETEFITNQRQQNCLQKSKDALNQALLTTQIHEVQDLISIDLKTALLCLEEITGEAITDDILNNIFEHFCIGK